jgi:antitoxin component of MazEF toxin-antitoxin module
MSFTEVTGRLLRWGNSFGIRLSKADVERLHLAPGQPVRILVEEDLPALDPRDLPRFDLGGDAADRHDELFGFPEGDDA